MISRYLFVAVVVAFSAACAPRVTIKHWPEKGKTKRVAVLPVRDFPGAPGSGAQAHAALSSAVLSISVYEVVERGALDDVLKEHQLGTSGLIDESKAVEIGRLLNADSILIGSLTEWHERRALILPPAMVALNLRMVEAKTGVVEWTATHRVGGLARVFTWLFWPVGIYATVTSPTADELVQRASRAMSAAVPKAAGL